MEIKADTLDDALHKCLTRLIRSKSAVSLDSTKGANRELSGVQVRIGDPRARFSRTMSRSQLFSSLGELFWYWSASDRLDHISFYIKKYEEESLDGETVPGAYGPRLFNMGGVNQIREVVSILKKKPSTRRAVIQLYSASDFGSKVSPPCTCTLQFLIRNGRLNLIVSMRSNDVWFGFPHDVFAFTMIQEIVCRKVGVELGEYIHSVGSLHLYAAQRDRALAYLKEGYQERIPMPSMPQGDPFPALRSVAKYEKSLRSSKKKVPKLPANLPSYWLDISRLLAVYSCYRNKNRAALAALRSSMDSPVYEQAISKRTHSMFRKKLEQTTLPLKEPTSDLA